jgi:hypothetical protein
VVRRGGRFPWLALVVMSALVAAPTVRADELLPQPGANASEPVASASAAADIPEGSTESAPTAPTASSTSTAAPAPVVVLAPEPIVIWLLDAPAPVVMSGKVAERAKHPARQPTAATPRAPRRKTGSADRSTASAVTSVKVEPRQHPQSRSRPQPGVVAPGVGPIRGTSLPAASVVGRARVNPSETVDESTLTSVEFSPVSGDENLIYLYRWDWKALVVALSGMCLLALVGMRRFGAAPRRTQAPEPAAAPEIPVTARLSALERAAVLPEEVTQGVSVRHSA